MRNRETQGDRQNMGFDQDLCGDFVSPVRLRSPGLDTGFHLILGVAGWRRPVFDPDRGQEQRPRLGTWWMAAIRGGSTAPSPSSPAFGSEGDSQKV